MVQTLQKSLLLLFLALVVCCGLYPLALWTVGQVFFPFEANGSIVIDSAGKSIGSLLIAQPFTKDEYFQPRPSAAAYNAAASASSALAPSNFLLRNRVANAIGPLVKYQGGDKDGKLVAPDIETWFQKDIYNGDKHILDQWASMYNTQAQAWVSADPSHIAYVQNWANAHPAQVNEFKKYNPDVLNPTATDLAVAFFQNFSAEHPGKFPGSVTRVTQNGVARTTIEPVNTGLDIQAIFFDMWQQDHLNVKLQKLPGDMVTTSASGLDPHITLQNAIFQLDRVAAKWASNLKRDENKIRNEINTILKEKTSAPLAGLAGEKIINVLEVNLELHKRYGAP
jgi:K+-transporting ATPase ATPase C chain